MVNSDNTHNGDEEFEASSSQKLKVQGTSGEQKTRSKHSETEQRRRSKINERFQKLKELLPPSDQKRDKATLLLEVIGYVQYLHDKINVYEGSYQGWNPEPAKLTPWRKHAGAAENLIGHSSIMRNGSSLDSSDIPTNMVSSPQNIMNSDQGRATLDKGMDNPTPGFSYFQSNMFAPVRRGVPTSHMQDSVFDGTHIDLQPQSPLWQTLPCTIECAAPNNSLNGAELNVESGSSNISTAYSQGVLNTLGQALQSSGVDLSQASISVQLDVAKRPTSSQTAAVFSSKEHQNPALRNPAMQQPGADICSSSDQAHKRPRAEES